MISMQNTLARNEVFNIVFGRSRQNGVVAIGHARKDKAGDVRPFPLAILGLRDQNDSGGYVQGQLFDLAEYEEDSAETLYWVMSTFKANIAKKQIRPPDEKPYIHTYDPEESLLLARGGSPVYYKKTTENLTELAAIVTDCDVGRPGQIDAETAAGIVLTAAMKNIIPAPAFLALSGRGLYVIHLLIDDEGLLPIASPDNLAVWKSCSKSLRQTLGLRNLAPDKTSAVQWYKMPDTRDHKTGNIVKYATLGTLSPGTLPRYTLAQLHKQLQLPIAPPGQDDHFIDAGDIIAAPPGRPPKRKTTAGRYEQSGTRKAADKKLRNTDNEKGAEMYRARFRELEAVFEHRKQIPEGMRHNCLRAYFIAYRAHRFMIHGGTANKDANSRKAFAEAIQQIETLNSHYCKPPLPHERLKAVAQNLNRMSSETILDLVQITKQEQDALGLRTLVPDEIKAQRKARETERKQKKAAQEEQLKQQFIELTLQGKTPKEVGEIVGLSHAAACNRLRRYISTGDLPDRTSLKAKRDKRGKGLF